MTASDPEARSSTLICTMYCYRSENKTSVMYDIKAGKELLLTSKYFYDLLCAVSMHLGEVIYRLGSIWHTCLFLDRDYWSSDTQNKKNFPSENQSGQCQEPEHWLYFHFCIDKPMSMLTHRNQHYNPIEVIPPRINLWTNCNIGFSQACLIVIPIEFPFLMCVQRCVHVYKTQMSLANVNCIIKRKTSLLQ